MKILAYRKRLVKSSNPHKHQTKRRDEFLSIYDSDTNSNIIRTKKERGRDRKKTQAKFHNLYSKNNRGKYIYTDHPMSQQHIIRSFFYKLRLTHSHTI